MTTFRRPNERLNKNDAGLSGYTTFRVDDCWSAGVLVHIKCVKVWARKARAGIHEWL